MRSRMFARVLLSVVALGATAACSPIEIPTTLAVVEGSSIEVGEGPLLATDLEGGIETTIVVDPSLLRLLFGLPIEGTISIDALLVAGGPLAVGPLDLGLLCADLDPAAANSGTISIDLHDHEAAIEMSGGTLFQVTNPAFNDLLGGGFPFTIELSEVVPISLADLLGVLGGASLEIELSQEFDTTLPPELPIVGSFPVHAVLNIATVEEFPSSERLDACAAFLAMP